MVPHQFGNCKTLFILEKSAQERQEVGHTGKSVRLESQLLSAGSGSPK